MTRKIGATFMKFGRAPAMTSIGIRLFVGGYLGKDLRELSREMPPAVALEAIGQRRFEGAPGAHGRDPPFERRREAIAVRVFTDGAAARVREDARDFAVGRSERENGTPVAEVLERFSR